MLYVMRTLSIIILTIAALVVVAHLVADVEESAALVATAANHETTKTSETTSTTARYLQRQAGEEREQTRQGAAWRATHQAPSSGRTAVCTTDEDCAAYDRAHGYDSNGTPGGARTPRMPLLLDGDRDSASTAQDDVSGAYLVRDAAGTLLAACHASGECTRLR